MKKLLLTITIMVITAMALTSCNKESAYREAQTAEMKDFSESSGSVTDASQKGTAANASSSAGGAVKLLESIVYENGSMMKIEYDSQNRIIKIFAPISSSYNHTFTLNYSGNDLTSIIRTPNYNDDLDYAMAVFNIRGNTIDIRQWQSDLSLTVNSAGFIVSSATEVMSDVSETAYRYQNGNLIKRTILSQVVDGFDENYRDIFKERFDEIDYKYDNMKSPFYYCNTPQWFLQWFFNMGINNNVAERVGRVNLNTYAFEDSIYAYEYDSDGFPISQLINNDSKTAFIYRAADAVNITAGAARSFTGGSSLSQTVRVAPNAPPQLPVGSAINGNLGSGQEIWYSVINTEAGFLTIETQGDIDTYLTVYDIQRNIIAENDDWNGLNAGIQLVAQANTSYLIRLSGYGSANGPYRILASHKPMPVITPLYSGSDSGFIESGQERWFSVLVSQIGILNARTTGGVDTVLEVYNTNFEYLFNDDNCSENSNAQINMEVKPGETYYFNLRASGDNSGPYEIIANVNPYPAPIQLSPGTFHNANIESGEEHWYIVSVTTGGSLTVETLGSTDTTLEAFTNDYEHIAYNDDTWIGEYVDRNARIEIFVYAPYGDTYIFKLRSFGPGSYRIIASFDEAKG